MTNFKSTLTGKQVEEMLQTAADLPQKVSDLSSRIEYVNRKVFKNTFISGYYLDAVIKGPKEDANWCYTEEYIKVKKGQTIKVIFGKVGETDRSIILYDNSKSPVNYYSTAGYTNERTFTLSLDVAYIRCSLSLKNIDNCAVYIDGKVVWETYDRNIEETIYELSNRGINGKTKKLLIGDIVQGVEDFKGGVNSTKLTRVCQSSITSVPYVGVTFKFYMPSSIKAVIVSGKVAGTPSHNYVMTDSGWIKNGDTYTIPEEDLFYRVNFANEDSNSNISPSTITSMIAEGSIYIEYIENTNVIERNEDCTKYAKAACLSLIDGSNQIGNMLDKMAIFSHISDLHGDSERYFNCLEYSKWFGCDAVLVSGDSVPYHYGNGSSWLKSGVDKYKTTMLTCIGNHEVWHGTAGSNTAIFANYIEPYASTNGYLENDGTLTTKPYYYKDFTKKKIRVIAINQYDCAVYGGQNRGGKLGQNQINWLISTLLSTPEGFGVIIMMHAYESALDKPNLFSAFNQKVFVVDYMNDGFYVNNIRPIMKIVDAFIGKTEINTSYTEVSSNGSTQDAEIINISADFSNVDASTEFICYVCGHRHEDVIGYYKDAENPQLVITVTSGTAHYGVDAAHDALANQEDIPRGSFGSTQDAFNVYAIDRINKLVKIARIGSNMTFQLEDRKTMSARYDIKQG